jgi:hypothetical protein
VRTRKGKPIVLDHPNRTEEIRHNRNWLRKGDPVKFREHHRRSDGTICWRLGVFLYADEDRGGAYYGIVEHKQGGIRSIRPENVERKAVATLKRKGERAD